MLNSFHKHIIQLRHLPC